MVVARASGNKTNRLPPGGYNGMDFAPSPPTEGGSRLGHRVAVGAAVLVGAIGGMIGVIAKDADKGPGDSIPGVSASDFPDRVDSGEFSLLGTSLERFMAIAKNLETNPGYAELLAAIEDALGSEIPLDEEYRTPPASLIPNTLFFLSPDTNRRLAITLIPSEGVDLNLVASPYTEAGIQPHQDQRLPGFKIYYDYAGDEHSNPIVPMSDATSGRALLVPEGSDRDYLLFVQLHQLDPSDPLNPAVLYGIAPPLKNGGDLALTVAAKIVEVVG